MNIMRNKSRKILGGALLASLCVPALVFASPVIRSGESVTVEQNQVVDGDFYGFGGASTISGGIKGDVYILSGAVTINAPVEADVSVVGGTLQVHAPIADDLRVIGGEVTLADTVAGDVAVFGGVLRILSTASITGDILFFGGELIVDGPVGGSIFGVGKDIRVNASIGGDIDVRASGGFTLGDSAEVLGNIVYKGNSDIVRSQNAVVVGEIQKVAIEVEALSLSAVLIPILAGLFAALTAFMLFRGYFVEIVAKTRTAYGVQGLVGLSVFVGLPFVAIILMVSVLGLLVGIFLLSVYVALLVASWVVASVVAGSFIMKLITKKDEVSIASVVLGVVVMEIALFIPLIGPLAVFATVLIALGAIAIRVYHKVSYR